MNFNQYIKSLTNKGLLKMSDIAIGQIVGFGAIAFIVNQKEHDLIVNEIKNRGLITN
jgi:hypothetical protein